MASLTTSRYVDPLQDIRREFDQLFDRFLGEGFTPLPAPSAAPTRGLTAMQQLVPQVDVRTEEGQLIIEVDLPGVPPDEVDIVLQDGMLTIRGKREDQHVENRGGLQVRERRFGEFERRIRLPEGVDENSVRASFENGVLTITAPMKPGVGQQRRIQVNQGQQGQTRGKVSQQTSQGQRTQQQTGQEQRSQDQSGQGERAQGQAAGAQGERAQAQAASAQGEQRR